MEVVILKLMKKSIKSEMDRFYTHHYDQETVQNDDDNRH